MTTLRATAAFALLSAFACAGPTDRAETGSFGQVDDDDVAPYVTFETSGVDCSGSNEYNYEINATVGGEATAVWADFWLGEDVVGTVELTDRTGDWYAEAAPNEVGGNRCVDVAEDLYVVFSASSNGDREAEDTAEEEIF